MNQQKQYMVDCVEQQAINNQLKATYNAETNSFDFYCYASDKVIAKNIPYQAAVDQAQEYNGFHDFKREHNVGFDYDLYNNDFMQDAIHTTVC